MALRGRATQQPRGTYRPTNQSSSFPNKMIEKPEWTQNNAQQNTEQLQNPTTGATRFSLFVATSVKNPMVLCYHNSLSCDLKISKNLPYERIFVR